MAIVRALCWSSAGSQSVITKTTDRLHIHVTIDRYTCTVNQIFFVTTLFLDSALTNWFTATKLCTVGILKHMLKCLLLVVYLLFQFKNVFI